MNRGVAYILMSILVIPFVLAACSTTQMSKGSAPIIKQILISPEAVAPGGFVRVSIDAVDSEGGYMSIKVGTAESLSYSDNNSFICQSSNKIGTEEVDIYVSNGRVDVVAKAKIRIDGALPPTTLHSGRACLPEGKSFDFETASIKNKYFGSLDYQLDGNTKILTTKGDGKGGELSYYYVDGGIVNLTYFKRYRSLSQIFSVYGGFYSASVDSDPYYEEQLLATGQTYGFFIIKEDGIYYGKFIIISMDSSQITFDWVFQSTPRKKEFYD